MSAAMQAAFAKALLDPDEALPADAVLHRSRAPRARFDVYRNNVVVSLIEALRARFPATARIVGDEFFDACARVFASLNPPRSPLMMQYGDEFPAFLGTFKPAASLPYLPDVARIEAARTRAYHAADARPLMPGDIAAMTPSEVFSAVPTLHPSLEVVKSDFPAVTVWAMNSGERELAPVDLTRAEEAVIVRPHETVLVRSLPPGGGAFILALRRGLSLGNAANTALRKHADFDLSASMALLIGGGLVTSLTQHGVSQP